MKWLILFLFFLPDGAFAAEPCARNFAQFARVPASLAGEEFSQLRAALQEADSILHRYNFSYDFSKNLPPYDQKLLDQVNRLQVWRRRFIAKKRELRFRQAAVRSVKRRHTPHSFDSQLNFLEAEIDRHQQIADRVGETLTPLRKWLGFSVIKKAALEVSREHNFVFVLRSLHPEAVGQMMHKGYGKGMRFKFHSADEGAIAGMVPVQQKFSKKGKLATPEELARMQEEVDQAIAHGLVVPIPHKIGSLVAVEREGKIVMVDSLVEKISQLKVVPVLAEPAARDEARIIVSDVDPFAFAFPNSVAIDLQTSKHYGVVTPLEKRAIREFNQKVSDVLNRQEPRNRYMLHGAENRNPHSKGINGYPLLAFYPDGSEKVIMAGPPEDPDYYYRRFVEDLKAKGYQLDDNPNW